MKTNIFVIILFFQLFSILAWSAEDSAYSQKARSRQYVGGPDESDLKVQATLVKLQKSKNETSLEDDEQGF